MTDKKNRISDDHAIGMDASITRRDFLGSTLLASGAGLLEGLSPAQLLAMAGGQSAARQSDDWTGYGGVGEYSRSNGNTFAVMEAGHKMRDGAYDPLPADTIDTGETYDCVVVGGGISGLAAGLFFQRQAGRAKRASSSKTIRSSEEKLSRMSSRSMADGSSHIKDRQFIWFHTLTVSSGDFTILLA